MDESNQKYKSPKEYLESEQQRLRATIRQLKEQIVDLQQGAVLDGTFLEMVEPEILSADAAERVERVPDLCDYLEILVANLFEKTQESLQQDLFAAAFTVQEISGTQEQLVEELDEWQQGQATQTSQPPSPQVSATKIGRLRNWLAKHLKPIIVKISRHLWQLISKMLKPQSWTLQGGISIPALANAQISITFG